MIRTKQMNFNKIKTTLWNIFAQLSSKELALVEDGNYYKSPTAERFVESEKLWDSQS